MQISCILSFFFPLVGCISYCVNSDAAKGSKRQVLASQGCYIAVGVVLLITILSFAVRYVQ